MLTRNLIGHLVALGTVFLWGITFISTKILLADFTALEILFIRFVMGWLALWAMCPRWLPFDAPRREILFAAAGFSGVTMYFLLENMALYYSFASNVSVIVTLSPFFTALLAWKFLKGERPTPAFFAGFVLAITGISLISFNGFKFSLNPLGDILAVLATFAWAFYSIFTRKLALLNLGSLLTTRRIFFYGLLFMQPLIWYEGFSLKTADLFAPVNAANFLFLGIGASAACFASWTFAVNRLGAIKASIYIYLVPVVSVITSAIVLREPLTPLSIGGTVLTILGLVVSEFARIFTTSLPKAR